MKGLMILKMVQNCDVACLLPTCCLALLRQSIRQTTPSSKLLRSLVISAVPTLLASSQVRFIDNINHSYGLTYHFIEELQNLLCGQALDLHWKYHTHCPAVEEYMMMIDNSKQIPLDFTASNPNLLT